MPYEKKLIQFNDRQNLGFSQTGSQFIYACALDLNKGEETTTTVCAVIFSCEWVFWSAHYMMTSVTGSNISLP